jgi:hypothetical protein
MVGIIPTPRRQPDEIILTIKLQTFNVRPYDSLVFRVRVDILNSETSLVICLPSLYDALVLYLEVLDVLWNIQLLTIVTVTVSILLTITLVVVYS